MEAACLSPDDFPEEAVEVWPENWPAYALFAFMRTQWRSGGMGVIGLDYGPLYSKMDRMELTSEAYEDLEADIQALEFAAIGAMNDRDE